MTANTYSLFGSSWALIATPIDVSEKKNVQFLWIGIVQGTFSLRLSITTNDIQCAECYIPININVPLINEGLQIINQFVTLTIEYIKKLLKNLKMERWCYNSAPLKPFSIFGGQEAGA